MNSCWVLSQLVALAACGGGGEQSAPTSTGAPTGSVGPAPGTDPTGPSVPAPSIQQARGSASRVGPNNPTGSGGLLLPFAVGLYAHVGASSKDENVVFSPASVAFALAMTANGARGRTLDEMLEVLGEGSLEELNAVLNAVDQALEERSGMRQGGFEREAEVTVRLANALWGQDGAGFEQPFLDELSRFYGAGMNLVDYQQDTESARQSINGWVATETAGKIPTLLAPGVLSTSTRLVLTNAIYLKAPWLEPFTEGATAAAPFTLVSGEQVSVDMMHVNARMGGYATGPGWTAVELPYIGGELAMTIVVPDDWAEFETGLSAEELGSMVAQLERRAFSLALPSWTTRTSTGLQEMLSAMGMPTAFAKDRADFSGMTADAQWVISAVVHEAYLAVDEGGTEAAAATAAVVDAVSAPAEPPPIVTVDRPFLYAVARCADQHDAVLRSGARPPPVLTARRARGRGVRCTA